MRNLTPANLCLAGSCPSVHELDDGRLMVVGKRRFWTDPEVAVGEDEAAIIIDRALLANIDPFPSNHKAPGPYEQFDENYRDPEVHDV